MNVFIGQAIVTLPFDRKYPDDRANLYVYIHYKIHEFESILSNLLHIFHHFEMGLQPHNKLYKRKTNKQMLWNQILIDHSKENLR